LQLDPWRHGRRWELNSGEGKARLGRERVGECLGAHIRPIPGVGRLRGRVGEGARRHQPLVAAASSPPAKLRRGRANTRHWRLQGILVKAARVPHGCGKEQEGKLAVEAPMADDDVGLCVGQWAAFIAGRLHGLRIEVRARRYSAVQRRASVGALSWGSGDGPLGSTRRPYGATRAPRRRLALRGGRREGD
jgi:hypothetical protein